MSRYTKLAQDVTAFWLQKIQSGDEDALQQCAQLLERNLENAHLRGEHLAKEEMKQKLATVVG